MNSALTERIIRERIKLNRTEPVCAWGLSNGKAICNILGYCLISDAFLSDALLGGQSTKDSSPKIYNNAGPIWPSLQWSELKVTIRRTIYKCHMSEAVKEQIRKMAEEKMSKGEII